MRASLATLRSVAPAYGMAAAFAAVLLLAAPASALQQTLTASDGAGDESFGTAVAVQGNMAVVGASGVDAAGGADAGAVYVFTRSGDTWTQTGKLTASDGSADDHLGSSVAIDGDTIVAGAPDDGVTMFEQGTAYVFSATGAANRNQTAKLIASDPGFADHLGTSVAIDGGTIVAGAPNNLTEHGAVYTFAETGPSTRNQTAKLTIGGGLNFDRLGAAVDIEGARIYAGAPGYEPSLVANTGGIFGFAATGAPARFHEARWIANDASSDDALGTAVAAAGDTLVGSAPPDDSDTGSAYTFQASAATGGSQTAKLTASDASSGGSFGDAIATDGQRILIGDRSDGATSGSVYRFDAIGAIARTELNRIPGDTLDLLGSSVGVDGATEAYGAPGDNINGSAGQGSVTLVFDPAPPDGPPGLTLAARKGKLGKPVKVKATCDEPCSLAAAGKLKAKGVKRPKLRRDEAEAAAGETLTLRLKPSARTKRELKEAERGKAVVEVTAADAAGNEATGKVKVKLKGRAPR